MCQCSVLCDEDELHGRRKNKGGSYRINNDVQASSFCYYAAVEKSHRLDRNAKAPQGSML